MLDNSTFTCLIQHLHTFHEKQEEPDGCCQHVPGRLDVGPVDVRLHCIHLLLLLLHKGTHTLSRAGGCSLQSCTFLEKKANTAGTDWKTEVTPCALCTQPLKSHSCRHRYSHGLILGKAQPTRTTLVFFTFLLLFPLSSSSFPPLSGALSPSSLLSC